MATMQGITGKLSGKMGSAVFRVRDGQQVVTQYNPIVKNPNSPAQQEQRAKFKLMSQLSAIMAPAFGSMSVAKVATKGNTTQRNDFTKINIPLVNVQTIDEKKAATIEMDKLQLTSSFRNLPPITAQAYRDSITVSINSIGGDTKKTRVVLVGYGTMSITRGGGDKQAYIKEIVDVPVVDGEIQHNFGELEAGEYTVLAYGLIPQTSTAAARLDLDSIHTPEDENFISAVVLDDMVSDGEMVETITVGANTTVTGD